MPTIDELKQVRINKLNKLRDLGLDPFPATINRKQKVSRARDMDGKPVAVAGRITALRGHGKIMFGDLEDQSGKVQLVFKSDEINKDNFKLLELVDIGDFLAVQGKMGKTQAGEVSVFAEDFQIITKSVRPLPDKWYGFKDVEERYRKRYLDMILNKEVKKTFMIRSQAIEAIREFLNKREFIEVETPTLQPVYGGGFARPFVTHHNELDEDLYLRISDEMYLKRMIVGGFDKVYEITKVFRNEGIDHDHNPEFTMFEAQIAYEDYTYGMDIIEEIFEYTTKKLLGSTKVKYQGVEMDYKRPWKRFKMVDSIKKFTGIDPLEWKTTVDAKKEITKLDISKEKFDSLEKMNSIGEMTSFVFEELVEEKLIQPTIIYEYPVEISPLAKRCTNPRFTQRFEMFVYGSELGNNYSELNDPVDLNNRFVEEKKRKDAGFEEAHQTDYDYLEAIEHGFPPTCGIAIGIDRFVMLLTDSKSIKEVIPFPTMRSIDKDEEKNQTSAEGGQDRQIPQKEINQNGKKTDSGQARMIEKRDKSQDLGIDINKAKGLVGKYFRDPVNKLHVRESEEIMRALARHFGEDEEKWGIIGLLHDIDWELTKDNTKLHCIKTAEILKENGGSDFLIETIQSHGYSQGWGDSYYGPSEFKGKERKTRIQHALAAAETLTGLVIATALVQPDKKLSSVKLKSLKKKFKTKAFAAGCNRDIIMECEKIGIPIDEFLQIGLTALQGISDELGL